MPPTTSSPAKLHADKDYERPFAWLAKSRCLARDYERLGSFAAGLHFAAFAFVMLALLARLAIPGP